MRRLVKVTKHHHHLSSCSFCKRQFEEGDLIVIDENPRAKAVRCREHYQDSYGRPIL